MKFTKLMCCLLLLSGMKNLDAVEFISAPDAGIVTIRNRSNSPIDLVYELRSKSHRWMGEKRLRIDAGKTGTQWYNKEEKFGKLYIEYLKDDGTSLDTQRLGNESKDGVVSFIPKYIDVYGDKNTAAGVFVKQATADVAGVGPGNLGVKGLPVGSLSRFVAFWANDPTADKETVENLQNVIAFTFSEKDGATRIVF